LKKKNPPITEFDEEHYQKLIQQVKESNERMKNLFYEEDPDEAIKRLSAELSLKNDLSMRIVQQTLSKYKTGMEELTVQEQQSFVKFLKKIPIFNGKIDDSSYNTESFKKMMQSLDIFMVQRCQYIYRKGTPIENVYYIMKGEVAKVEELSLDLKFVLNVPYNPKDVKFLIARLLKRKLIMSLPEIYANTALKRFTALGRQKYFIDDIEYDENFLRSSKRQVCINEKLCIDMRK
jgi:hypothetical protein